MCPKCDAELNVPKLASALVSLFCDDCSDIDRKSEGFGQHLLLALAGSLWGRGGGRNSWWSAGCPITLDEIDYVLSQDDDSLVSPLMNFLVHRHAMESLHSHHPSFSISAIQALHQASDPLVRWSLYSLLLAIPHTDAITHIEALKSKYPEMDGNDTRPVGRAASAALFACHQLQIAEQGAAGQSLGPPTFLP